MDNGAVVSETNATILKGEAQPESWDGAYNQEKIAEARAAGQVKSADETINWGGSGEVTGSVGRDDVPQNAPTGISPSVTHAATELPAFSSVAPTRNRSREGGPSGGACNSFAEIMNQGRG